MSPRCGLVALGLLASSAAIADPDDYVQVPTVVAGEREIDFKYGSARFGDETTAQAASVGLGLGANDWWFTELYLKYARDGAGPVTYDALEWENKFQLTETGKYPFEFGVVTEVEVPNDRSQGYELTLGGLGQTELGRLQLNGNLYLTRKVRSDLPQQTDFAYRWQVKYRWREFLEYGFQGLGDLGPWDHWARSAEQVRRAGPAVFGKIHLAGRHAIEYNAAWLIGTSAAAADHTFRLQVEYEF